MEFSLFGVVGVGVITVICYLIGLGIKAIPLEDKWIPVICGVCGGILGVVAMYSSMPDFPAHDILTAIAIGIVSGLAATGANQIYKQLKEDK